MNVRCISHNPKPVVAPVTKYFFPFTSASAMTSTDVVYESNFWRKFSILDKTYKNSFKIMKMESGFMTRDFCLSPMSSLWRHRNHCPSSFVLDLKIQKYKFFRFRDFFFSKFWKRILNSRSSKIKGK